MTGLHGETAQLAGEAAASVVAVGNFDGVHLGHRAILRRVVEQARGGGFSSVAVTFDPHPAALLGFAVPPRLMRPKDRAARILSLGIDRCVTQPFTKSLAALSAKEFVTQWLLRRLNMKILCIGPTTQVGRGREGTPERLRELSSELGFRLDLVPEVRLDGAVVNSSRIRSLIVDGEVARARRLLGRPYRTAGIVQRGAGRGRTIGFPTANVGRIETLLPMRGVYAASVAVGGEEFPAAANVGTRPTVDSGKTLTVEAHLLGFRGGLLGKEVEIDWHARLRDERAFGSLEELRAQIGADCARVRSLAGTSFDEGNE